LKAVVFRKNGSPDVLEINDVEKPIIKDDEVLVKVYAVSVNPIDVVIRKNRIMSFFVNRGSKITGSDLSGKIVSVGKTVVSMKNGDDVFGFRQGGTTAEYVAISENKVAIKPINMTFEEAAAVPLAALTALQALRDKGNICSGQNILINGASGGVGTYAVQIAKSFGTDVTGVSSTKNLELIKSLGADKVIDYTKEDFTRTNQRYDIILDAVAKSSFSKCKKILNKGGIFISTRFSPLLLIQVVSTALFGSEKAKTMFVNSNTKDLEIIGKLIKEGKVKSVVEQSYPMNKTSEAHLHIENGHTIGKVVITIN
jgi:NADPH:quinone reductase-like Zn-dependent oxidoreductase